MEPAQNLGGKKKKSFKRRRNRATRLRNKRSMNENVDHFIRNNREPNDYSCNNPSNFYWFWNNYHRVNEWRALQEVEYRRAFTGSKALENENQRLDSLVGNNLSSPLGTMYRGPCCSGFRDYRADGCSPNNKYQGQCQKVSEGNGLSANHNPRAHDNQEQYQEVSTECIMSAEQTNLSSNEGDDYEFGINNDSEETFHFDINEEMMAFLEQSMRHRQELQRQREQEENNTVPPDLILKEKTEKRVLDYGKAQPKINAMETASTLSFERRLRLKDHHYWPVVAIK